MDWILCEILDEKGQVLAQSGQVEAASLILPYGGRSVTLRCGKPGSHCVIQLEVNSNPLVIQYTIRSNKWGADHQGGLFIRLLKEEQNILKGPFLP